MMESPNASSEDRDVYVCGELQTKNIGWDLANVTLYIKQGEAN